MMRRSAQSAPESDNESPLSIGTDKVCWLIRKVREFDVKDAPTIPDPASNATDDNMASVLEDRPNDPVEQEIKGFVDALSEDEQVDLVALMWLGREDNAAEDWESLRAEAVRARGGHAKQTAAYLLGEPLLGDFLEEGLSVMGQSCVD